MHEPVPAYLLQMVKIAEETGTLDEVMQALSDHYAREDAIMHSIRSAVAYPAVMAGMMIAVIIILLVKVMPIFNQVFIQLGTEMTGISRGLMNVGTVLNRYSMFFLALLVLAPCGWPDPPPIRQRPQLFLRNALSFPPFPHAAG